jgi:hypothetical protein
MIDVTVVHPNVQRFPKKSKERHVAADKRYKEKMDHYVNQYEDVSTTGARPVIAWVSESTGSLHSEVEKRFRQIGALAYPDATLDGLRGLYVCHFRQRMSVARERARDWEDFSALDGQVCLRCLNVWGFTSWDAFGAFCMFSLRF